MTTPHGSNRATSDASPAVPPLVVSVPAHASPGPALVDRRGFLTAAGASTLSALLLAACGGETDSPTAPVGSGNLPAGVERTGNTLRVNLAVATALQSPDGFLIVTQPPTIIVNAGGGSFKAFTAVCTHAGCLVGSFANGRITCPCHGSQYDLNGQVVTGPAPSALATYPVSFDVGANTLSVTTP